MQWILVLMVIIGDFLIVKKMRLGFLFWVLADGYFSFLNFIDGEYAQGTVFAVYCIMGFYGLYTWKKD